MKTFAKKFKRNFVNFVCFPQCSKKHWQKHGPVLLHDCSHLNSGFTSQLTCFMLLSNRFLLFFACFLHVWLQLLMKIFTQLPNSSESSSNSSLICCSFNTWDIIHWYKAFSQNMPKVSVPIISEYSFMIFWARLKSLSQTSEI